MKKNTLLSLMAILFSVFMANAQCAYTGTPLTQVGSDYTFCIDNGNTYTTGTVNAGQYVVVNVVKGFTYTFSVGNVFGTTERLTILDASTNANVSPSTTASGSSGTSITGWVASLSGKIKILLSRGSCLNDNTTGGALTLTLTAVGNTQDSQTAAGTDQWIGHVYNWTGSAPPGGTSPNTPSANNPFTNANYVGYYTVSTETFSEGFGGDANCFPVYSNGVIRTNIYTELFAVRYRMHSTKTGCYMFSATGDDGMRVYVDGVKVYDEWKEQSPTSYTNVLLYLNGNSDIVFDYYENGGGNVNSFMLTPFDAGSNTVTQSTVNVCTGVSPGVLNGSSYPYNQTVANPSIAFQWQSSTDNVTFSNISGATAEDYTPPTQTTTTSNIVRYYKRVATPTASNASSCTTTSNVVTVTTSPSTPSTPGTISGVASQCASVTGQVYSIAAVSKAVSYNWTVPTGWTITAGAGTTSITVTTGTTGQNGNISVSATNGCGTSAVKTLAVTVSSSNTAGTGSSTPTLCIDTALTAITHTTTGATGIGTATGLPAGVTAAWASNTISISGTPTVSGTFNYSIPLTGGCGSVNATGTITVTPNKTVSDASSSPTVCINTALPVITHTTTGANAIVAATGLPTGVTAAWASNTITISGTPTVSGTFNYSIPLTGGCGSVNATGTITVTPNMTAGTASSATTLCLNTSLTAITHTTAGATGIGLASGLPTGVEATWASNTVTITGTPTTSGTFNYTIPLTGGCGTANATGTITVTPSMTASAASSSPTLCVNTSLTAITHTTTGATGIGTATGLPSGVTASWASNTITISGTPSASGIFNYSIPLTGGCGNVNATGTITVTAAKTAGAASSTPTLCINTALTAITHTTTGATGIGTATGLPTGVTANWASNTITISGTPSAAGTFNYSIPLTGGCGSANAAGTITVNATKTAGAASSTPTLCINTALTAITHTTTGATGIGTATGLPTGVTANWASNTITISGTPSAAGTFNYSIPLTGGCGSANATGTITVTATKTAGAASSTPTLCISTALTTITHTTTGATGIGTATGLPTGVTANWASNTITISGTPSAAGTFNYSIPLTGGCGSANATGTITVTAAKTAGAASSTPTLCINTALTAITHTTTGATGIGTATGLPAGVTANWASNTITISGTPSAAGTFNYSIPLTGGCGSINAIGTIIVVPAPVGGTVSGGTNVCSGATSGVLTLSGHTGNVVRWEYAVSPFTTWTPISNTQATYTSGSITQTTKFRAVVQSATCGQALSSIATIGINATTWTNGTWSNGAPTATTAAIISEGYTSAGSLNACSLTVNNNATVLISSGDSVTLQGALTVETGSTVTFNNNANLIQGGTTNQNSGVVKIKRSSSALIRQDYTAWSSPVANQALLAFSPSTLVNRFYTYNTGSNLYDVVAAPSTTVFEAAKGYLIRVPNNHPTTPTIWTGQFSGVPNNGNYSFPLIDAGVGNRFNLVGNPYPSPIDINAFMDNANNASSILGALYFWRKTNNAASPSYCTWTQGGFVSNGEAQVYDPNDVIQTGQGFFVEASGNGATVNFDNTMRINNHANQFFKTATIERDRIWLNATSSTGLFSQTMVGYMTNATQGYDPTIDGKFMNNGEIALASLIETTAYAIQGRALPFEDTDVVPLSFKVTNGGSYTITIDHVDGLFLGSQGIYLRDNLTGTVHDLHAGGYVFTSEPGTFDTRFELLYQSSTLGVTHQEFNASQVILYKDLTNNLVISTGTETMASVKIFDLTGKLLIDKKDINSNKTAMNVGLSNEMVLVQIATDKGVTVTKKFIGQRVSSKEEKFKLEKVQLAEDE